MKNKAKIITQDDELEEEFNTYQEAAKWIESRYKIWSATKNKQLDPIFQVSIIDSDGKELFDVSLV